MLNRLRIEQFKAFGTAQDISLAPITLIYGPNSAGKSAVIEALLLLHQTMADNDRTHALAPNGPWLNLRHYQTLIHRHEEASTLGLGLFWTSELSHLLGISNNDGGSPMQVDVGMAWTWTWDPVRVQTVQQTTEIFLADVHHPLFRLNISAQDFAPPLPPKPNPVRDEQMKKFFEQGGTVEELVGMTFKVPESDAERENQWKTWAHRTQWDPAVPIQWIERHLKQPDKPWQRLTKELTGLALSRWEPVVEHLRWWKEAIQANPRLAEKYLLRVPWGDIDDRAPWMENDDSWTDEGFAEHFQHLLQAPWDEWISWMIEPSPIRQAQQWAMTFEQNVKQQDMEAFYESPLRWEVAYRPTMGQHDWHEGTEHFSEYSHLTDYLIPHLLKAWYLRLPQKMRSWIPIPNISGDLPDLWLPPTAVVGSLNHEIGGILHNIAFVGPIRTRFGPTIERDDNPKDQVGNDGRYTVDRLAQHPEQIEAVNAALAAMDIGYRVSVAPVDDPDLPRLWKLRLWDETLGVFVSMDQVGYGVSQILPLVVEVITGEFPLTLLEQPELHLHPRLQAAFGAVLAQAITANPSRQFIIETHSETLLLRLRKLIRTGDLAPEAVSIVYIDKTSEGSQALPIRLDSQGNFLDPWPHGFFEEGFDELFGGAW